MSVNKASVHAKWIIGKVVGTKMQKTAKVRVTRMVLDPYLLKFYNKKKTYFAHDVLQQCTVGDIVLLKALTERRSKHVKHELAEIVHKVGKGVDPLTGKRVAGTDFLEPLSDPTQRLEQETTLTEKLRELNISAASSDKSSACTKPASSSAATTV
ncbi:28S ribosomal protein S17, mitochondrial [Hypomesus transpacificus]|uniref:28S ribosomal protein S17, mitochondrial n=1 Tax=Hypomesus transpacificus TaxID=137520 RepID=UPI001F080686|nr:28S ribosomal protein S17, mitochondrial [Hypomesus transpacificus]